MFPEAQLPVGFTWPDRWEPPTRHVQQQGEEPHPLSLSLRESPEHGEPPVPPVPNVDGWRDYFTYF